MSLGARLVMRAHDQGGGGETAVSFEGRHHWNGGESRVGAWEIITDWNIRIRKKYMSKWHSQPSDVFLPCKTPPSRSVALTRNFTLFQHALLTKMQKLEDLWRGWSPLQWGGWRRCSILDLMRFIEHYNSPRRAFGTLVFTKICSLMVCSMPSSEFTAWKLLWSPLWPLTAWFLGGHEYH